MNFFNTKSNRKSWGIITCATILTIIATVFPNNGIHAQISAGKISLGGMQDRAKKNTSDKTCRGQFCGHVFISPTEIKISSDSVKGDSVVLVLELSNRTDTTITGVWKAYDVVPPQAIGLDSTDSEHSLPSTEKRTGSLLADEGDDPESSENGMTLSTWLTGFPDSVTIEPHTTIKMNVIVRVPKGLKEGSYTGWLGAMSEIVGNRPPPQKPIRMGIISRVKIAYEASMGDTNNKDR